MKRIAILFLSLMFIPLIQAEAIAEPIRVDMHYLVVDPMEDGNILVKHMVTYSNIGSEVYKGAGEEGVLTIPLPPGAINLQVQEDGPGVIKSNNSFSTSKPIQPNESQVLSYSYEIPAGVPVVLQPDYSLEAMQILIAEGDGSLKFAHAGIGAPQTMQIDGTSYWLYNVANNEAGKEIKFSYSKDDVQPAAASTEAPQNAHPSKESGQTGSTVTKTSPEFHNPGHIRMWDQSPLKRFDPHILMIVFGVIAIAGMGYYSYFRWKRQLEGKKLGEDRYESEFRQLLARQNAIMDRIAELGENHSHGKIGAGEYQAKLAAYKDHLITVKQNLRQFVE
ncbi:hypothetical protein WQ57_25230 [Mesobacillus campisalis]|uniref:Uncharacterized protein n=1 Tax=Mesobacillus campisalis TaxID=1408103 RepID=A0A0M2SHX0_9BACI|nr:hypothetical protein [Mesobacillus campisalis]KKK33226.1 hypothetical protein WQ57_25230 [Mesobacillus campisalis]